MDVQRVDVVFTVRRQPDDLPTQPSDQRMVFTFRVTDDDIVPGDKKGVDNLTLGSKGFTAAWDTENQAVWVFQLFAIHHDHVIGQCVQTVIQRFTASLEQLPGHEGNEDGRA